MLLDIRIPPRSPDDREMQASRYISEKREKRAKQAKAPQFVPRHDLPPLARRQRANAKLWSEDEIADVMALTELRYSRGEIGKAYGVSRPCICGVIFKERRRQFKRLAEEQKRAA